MRKSDKIRQNERKMAIFLKNARSGQNCKKSKNLSKIRPKSSKSAQNCLILKIFLVTSNKKFKKKGVMFWGVNIVRGFSKGEERVRSKGGVFPRTFWIPCPDTLF